MTVLYIMVPSIAEHKKRYCCLGIHLQCMYCSVLSLPVMTVCKECLFFITNWQIQNVCTFSLWNGSSFTWHQPCNNQIMLSIHHLVDIKKRRKKCYKRLQSLFENHIVQELRESRGGRPGLSVLTRLLVSMDVKLYWTVLRHWSQLVPNMSPDIWGH